MYRSLVTAIYLFDYDIWYDIDTIILNTYITYIRTFLTLLNDYAGK